jgi:hypothetical protein
MILFGRAYLAGLPILFGPSNWSSGVAGFRATWACGHLALIRTQMSVFLPTRFCALLTRANCGSYTEWSSSEHINGFDTSALNANT